MDMIELSLASGPSAGRLPARLPVFPSYSISLDMYTGLPTLKLVGFTSGFASLLYLFMSRSLQYRQTAIPLLFNYRSMERIKCIIKKWQRFAKIRIRSYGARPSREQSIDNQCRDDKNNNNVTVSPPVHSDQEGDIPAMPPKGYVAVYVGNSRRRYVISCQYINHPLLSVLIQKSGGEDHEYLTVGCEVVLFEHLLWMLQNGDEHADTLGFSQNDSLEELVEFYVC